MRTEDYGIAARGITLRLCGIAAIRILAYTKTNQYIMAQSLISETIPQSVIDDVTKKHNEIIALLQPYTVGLSPDQRHELVKMGDKSVSYADKVADYLQTSPDYLPRRFDAGEFAKDYAVPRQLSPVHALARKVEEMLNDTMMAAGSDVMMVCNAYYNAVQDAVHDGDAGAKAIFEDLKARYPYTSKKKQTFPGS